MSAGKRLQLVTQAGLVWADRDTSAFQRYIDTGTFGELTTDSEPYSQDAVKQILATGMVLNG